MSMGDENWYISTLTGCVVRANFDLEVEGQWGPLHTVEDMLTKGLLQASKAPLDLKLHCTPECGEDPY